ncbi:hypothetical protein [Bartonella vinsonii]|nr:hypothetical protein [Bartonella vinsonii]
MLQGQCGHVYFSSVRERIPKDYGSVKTEYKLTWGEADGIAID